MYFKNRSILVSENSIFTDQTVRYQNTKIPFPRSHTCNVYPFSFSLSIRNRSEQVVAMKNVTVHTEVKLSSNWKFRYSHVSCILCNRSSRSIKLGIGHRVEFSSRIPGVESNLPQENNSIIYRGEDRSTFATFRNVSTFPPRLLTRQLESLSMVHRISNKGPPIGRVESRETKIIGNVQLLRQLVASVKLL